MRRCLVRKCVQRLLEPVRMRPLRLRALPAVAALGLMVAWRVSIHWLLGHPDFGENQTYGIPFNVVPGTQPKVPITWTAYGDESDPGPYPIPADAKTKQAEFFKAQMAEDPKAPPAASHPKIIEGKLAKWAKEICLLDQPSVLEGDKTVDQVRAAVGKELGGDVVFSRFVRFERGEGIEKPTGDDFAAEVAKMAGG